MKEMMNMVKALEVMMVENKMNSKLEGRNNWTIRVETRNNNRVIVYHGGAVKDAPFWVDSCKLCEIGERDIRWYRFTYKKDYMEALKTLLNNGAIDGWKY